MKDRYKRMRRAAIAKLGGECSCGYGYPASLQIVGPRKGKSSLEVLYDVLRGGDYKLECANCRLLHRSPTTPRTIGRKQGSRAAGYKLKPRLKY